MTHYGLDHFCDEESAHNRSWIMFSSSNEHRMQWIRHRLLCISRNHRWIFVFCPHQETRDMLTTLLHPYDTYYPCHLRSHDKAMISKESSMDTASPDDYSSSSGNQGFFAHFRRGMDDPSFQSFLDRRGIIMGRLADPVSSPSSRTLSLPWSPWHHHTVAIRYDYHAPPATIFIIPDHMNQNGEDLDHFFQWAGEYRDVAWHASNNWRPMTSAALWSIDDPTLFTSSCTQHYRIAARKIIFNGRYHYIGFYMIFDAQRINDISMDSGERANIDYVLVHAASLAGHPICMKKMYRCFFNAVGNIAAFTQFAQQIESFVHPPEQQKQQQQDYTPTVMVGNANKQHTVIKNNHQNQSARAIARTAWPFLVADNASCKHLLWIGSTIPASCRHVMNNIHSSKPSYSICDVRGCVASPPSLFFSGCRFVLPICNDDRVPPPQSPLNTPIVPHVIGFYTCTCITRAWVDVCIMITPS